MFRWRVDTDSVGGDLASRRLHRRGADLIAFDSLPRFMQSSSNGLAKPFPAIFSTELVVLFAGNWRLTGLQLSRVHPARVVSVPGEAFLPADHLNALVKRRVDIFNHLLFHWARLSVLTARHEDPRSRS